MRVWLTGIVVTVLADASAVAATTGRSAVPPPKNTMPRASLAPVHVAINLT
jgi:hypothetical protein